MKLPLIGGKKRVCLALGGGAARGWTHIGVIDALLEEGYEIEAVAGSSVGAVVGSYYAAGKLEELRAFVLGLTERNQKKFLDWKLPLRGLMGDKKICMLLDGSFGDERLQHTKTPMFVVTTNLVEGTKYVFDRGNIARAVRTSIAAPGFLTPVIYRDEPYVDGSITEPVPVSVLKERRYRNIIAVDLNHYLRDIDYKAQENMNIVGLVSRSFELLFRTVANYQVNDGDCFKVMRPDLRGFKSFDFYRGVELIDLGYRTAKAALRGGVPEDYPPYDGRGPRKRRNRKEEHENASDEAKEAS